MDNHATAGSNLGIVSMSPDAGIRIKVGLVVTLAIGITQLRRGRKEWSRNTSSLVLTN